MRRTTILAILLSVTIPFAADESRAQECDSPDGCATCPEAPTKGCSVSATSTLRIVKSPDGQDSRLAWTFGWGNGAPSQSSFGNPTVDTSYSLCIYDGEALRMNGSVPANPSLWSAIGTTGYKYAEAGASEGLGSIKLQSGPDAEVSMSLKGRGAGLPLPDAAEAGVHYFDPKNPVTLQWRVNGGACWSSTFAPKTVVTNDGSTYEAKF